jgi:hypothetical protein
MAPPLGPRLQRLHGIWFWKVGALGLAGLAGAVVAGSRQNQTALTKLVSEIGVALAVSALIALTVERLLHESLFNEFNAAIRFLEQHSGLLKGASELRIQDIFARYGHVHSSRQRGWAKVIEAITEQLERKSGEILISCVAGPSLFRDETEVAGILRKGLVDIPTKCKLRVLLLCPSSDWARIRRDLEPSHPTISDIITSGNCLETLRQASGDKVETNCYTLPPFAFLLITDRLLFLEPYPFAKTQIGEGPIGGKTPMLVLESDSEAFGRWKEHFEQVWKHPTTKPYQVHHRAEELPRTG